MKSSLKKWKTPSEWKSTCMKKMIAPITQRKKWLRFSFRVPSSNSRESWIMKIYWFNLINLDISCNLSVWQNPINLESWETDLKDIFVLKYRKIIKIWIFVILLKISKSNISSIKSCAIVHPFVFLDSDQRLKTTFKLSLNRNVS